MDKPQIYTASVSSVTRLAGEFYLGTFALVDPKAMCFDAGQYIIFYLPPPKLKHTMSIASPPSREGDIEILQYRVPGGEGSMWFTGLAPGDPVRFLGPLGTFVLSCDTVRPIVFVATGSGIAPIRSMIVDTLKGQGTINNKHMTLFWGLRHEADVFWKDEFEAMTAAHTNFRFMLTLSQPTDAWKGARGRVTEHVMKEIENLKDAEFYLCGNRAMIVDMRGILAQNGVPLDQIFTETFF